MSLDQWQHKIEEHFQLLHDFRSGNSKENTVFALEHGLNSSELNILKTEIREYIAKNEPSISHWLPWVVYASEIGYAYDGQEYWQTFESNTPGWTRLRNANRYWIKRCFIRFHDEYGGIEPSGPWAEHFNIICWPIRHAILPRDLQEQLAKALFDLRLSFQGELFQSSELLGNFIGTHCRAGTKRFRDLLEDPILVGQLSIALLLQGQKISEELLLKETQLRIVEDLGRKQIEREWLHSAQKHAISTYIGMHRNAKYGIVYGPRYKESQVSESLRIQNAPRIYLYPKSNGKDWGVKLELQDLRSLVARIRFLEPVIANNYFTIAGSNGSPRPKGMFLRPGPHSFFPLIRWPSDDEVLINFEDAPSELNSFLKMDQLIPWGDVHLFKIDNENIGYEIHQRHLRPSKKYVVLSRTPLPEDPTIFKPFPLVCEGIHSALISTPEKFTLHFEQVLKIVDLSCAKSLKVWPVGIPAKEWDDDGYGVWLTGSPVRLAIQADFEICGLEVVINDDTSIFYDEIQHHNIFFLKIEDLPCGENLIEITAIANQAEENTVGYISVIIQEPQVWDIKSANQAGLKSFINPEAPSLEDIWCNNLTLEVFGPSGRDINCKLSFFDGAHKTLIREKQISGLKLPLYGQNWMSCFGKQVKKDALMQEAYDLAYTGELFFDAEEIGNFTILAERRSSPIRWYIHKSGQNKRLRFINETETEKIKVYTLPFTEPDNYLEITKLGLENEIEFSEGGLFLIQAEEKVMDSIVMPSFDRKLGLKDMNISPHLKNEYSNNDDIYQLLLLYDLWEHSRISGNILCEYWRNQVLKHISFAISSNLCGKQWETAEIEYSGKGDSASLHVLKNCISNKSDERYIGSVLERESERLASIQVRDRKKILEQLFTTHMAILSRRYGTDQQGRGGVIIRTSHVRYIPEFLLRLASAPNSVFQWEKDDIFLLIKNICEYPVMLRAARYLVFAVEKYSKDIDHDGCCYRGWNWI